jgi:hypothetical protein
MKIIGIAGKARHGKNTLADIFANILKAKGYEPRIVGFADAVKNEAKARGWNGEKDEAGRALLQNVGMEARADNPNYWVDVLMGRMLSEDSKKAVWIITDVRFQNEIDAINAKGGNVIKVERRNDGNMPFDNGLTAEQKKHPSEAEMDKANGLYTVLLNISDDPRFLRVNANSLLNELSQDWKEHEKPLTIYVAGPYTPKTTNVHDASRLAQQNTDRAIRAGIECMKKGHIPYIPHLTHYILLQMHDDEVVAPELWYEFDNKWLKDCNALLYLAPSPGADAELEYAKAHGLTVFRSIEEIPPREKEAGT